MMRRLAAWVASRLMAYGMSDPVVQGPVYLVDMSTRTPKVIKGPMDEQAARTWCPTREVMSPAIVWYGGGGPVVKYEWDAVNMAWRRPYVER